MTELSDFIPYAVALWNGFTVTFFVSLIAILGSLVIGTLIALIITSGPRGAATLGRSYVELFRNIPFLVLIFFFYFGLPELGIFINSFWTGAMALSLAVGAYVADAVRSGISSIDRGIISASETFGFTRTQRIRYIILPPGISCLPAAARVYFYQFDFDNLVTVDDHFERTNKFGKDNCIDHFQAVRGLFHLACAVFAADLRVFGDRTNLAPPTDQKPVNEELTR